MTDLQLAIEISLTGILIVFISLSMIPLLIKVINWITQFFNNKEKSEVKSTKPEGDFKREQIIGQERLDDEELAVICAAVNYYLADEKQNYMIKEISQG